MSILIEGMKKPETCSKCPFCQFGGFPIELRCLVTDEVIFFDATKNRAGNCPLVEIPSADVVEVVRCKDCKKRNTRTCMMNNNVGMNKDLFDDDYCSYGVKKDE